jgi:hypothetical protein
MRAKHMGMGEKQEPRPRPANGSEGATGWNWLRSEADENAGSQMAIGGDP